MTTVPITLPDQLAQEAQRAAQQAQIIRLSRADQQCFADALLSPPKAQPVLERAIARRNTLLRTDHEGNKMSAIVIEHVPLAVKTWPTWPATFGASVPRVSQRCGFSHLNGGVARPQSVGREP